MLIYLVNRNTGNKTEVLDHDMIFEEGMLIRIAGKTYTVEEIDYDCHISGTACNIVETVYVKKDQE